MRGMARLNPASIVVGALFGGISLHVVYSRKYLSNRRKASSYQHSINVSDARIYSRYEGVMDALEKVGTERGPHETPEEYARRYAGDLGNLELSRLGEIYLYARFRDAMPLEMVEEFDHLEPRILEAIEWTRSPEPAKR